MVAQQQQVRPDQIPMEGQPDQRVNSDERTWAVIGHAVSFVEGGVIGPLIIYLIKRDSSPFVAFHALQSLYFGLAMLVAMLITFITIIGPIALAVVYWVYEILACVKAHNGEWYMMPMVGKWAAKTHPIPAVYPMQPPSGQPVYQQPPPQQPPPQQPPPQQPPAQ